jgi:hypothetical protein
MQSRRFGKCEADERATLDDKIKASQREHF